MTFTRAIRSSMRHREGQALVLACLMMLVLTLAVVTTINVGHTIHERVRLQNTADAAAFSMAALEARAFNFYAFANRTQVSHYVSSMMWMSVDSLLYGMEAFMTDAFGLLATLLPGCVTSGGIWALVCVAGMAVPFIAPLLLLMDALLVTLKWVLKNVIQLGLQWGGGLKSADELFGKDVVPTFRSLNRVTAGMSAAMMDAVHAQIGQTTEQVIRDNDPNLNAAVSQVLTGQLSTCLFDRAHSPEMQEDLRQVQSGLGEIDPREAGDTNGRALAKRAMGQIANASRYPCDGQANCAEGLITRRTLSGMLPLPSELSKVLDDLLRNMEDPSNKYFNNFGKVGQTKLLSHSWADGRTRNRIRDWKELPDQGYSVFAQGDNMGADDLYWFRIGKDSYGPLDNPFSCGPDDDPLDCHGDPRAAVPEPANGSDAYLRFGRMLKPSIWAMNAYEGTHADGGIHYRVVLPTGMDDAPGIAGMRPQPPNNQHADVGINQRKVGLIHIYVANIRGVEDGNHPWRGLVPFPHFEPSLFQSDCPGSGAPNRSLAAVRQTVADGDFTTRNTEFNQPSTWVVLNKQAHEMKNPLTDPTGAGSNAPALLNDEGKLDVKLLGAPGVQLELEDDRVQMSGLNLSTGVNAIARGQTYYHRPGNWNEQPNFFNPYWRPRLAPVQQGLYSFPLLRDLVSQLPGPFRDAPASRADPLTPCDARSPAGGGAVRPSWRWRWSRRCWSRCCSSACTSPTWSGRCSSSRRPRATRPGR